METLSLREMIWLVLCSAWASPSLGRRSGANPWIVHAERSAAVAEMAQWRWYSAWSEEGIRAAAGIRAGPAGRLRAPTVPIHAEHSTVRIAVPHGRSLESARARA